MATDLCRRAVVGGVVEGGWEARFVGQTGVLALDGVGVLVGVAAVVVASRVPNMKTHKQVSTLHRLFDLYSGQNQM